MRSGQTPDFMDDLKKEKTRILLGRHFSLFLKVFVAGFILAGGTALPLVYWTLNAHIQVLKEQATTANDRRQKWEEESKRQTQVAEYYRDRFLGITQTNESFKHFTHEDLRNYALKMARALQVPIREHEQIVNNLESNLWSGMAATAKVEDLQKTLEERSTAEWQAGQECMAEYNIRFKANVLMLRREILSRIPVGNELDQNGLPMDYWYESPWNFYGFKKIVTDLDRIARQLPVSSQHAKTR